MRRLLAGLLVCAACGGGSTGGGGGGGGTGRIRMVPNVVAGSQAGAGGAAALHTSALRIGQGPAVSLKSLKYYVYSIQLCQNLTMMGSGFSNPEGCIELYNNQTTASPDYPSYTVDQAKDDNTPGRYIDLMSAAGQAILRRPVTLEVPVAPDPPDGGGPAPDAAPEMRVGAYRYGLINFYRPIKVTAEFPVLGQPGQYFRTKSVTNVRTTPAEGGGFNSQTVEIGDSLSGATEETTYMLNNGGVLFTFQKPFVITQSDIDAQAEIKIDLVFNPDSFGQAHEVGSCAGDRRNFICDPLNNVAFDMPYVRMSPVPRKSGERTRKESYLLDYDSTSKLRIELYYNDGDPEAGVQGVDVALVYLPTATEPNFNTVSAAYVTQIGSVTSNDASVSLLDYQRSVNLAGLRRRQSGTATMHCLLPHPVCPTAGGTAQKAYSYVGDTLVSSD